GRRLRVTQREHLVSQLRDRTAVATPEKRSKLPAQKIAAVQGRQAEKLRFGFAVAETRKRGDPFRRCDRIGAHSERIATVMSRSSRTRASLAPDPSAAKNLK